jgi:hypothetical protein
VRKLLVTGEKSDLNAPEKEVGHNFYENLTFMKKLIKLMFIGFLTLSLPSVAFSQNQEIIHQGIVIGSFEFGSKEITTIYDQNTWRIVKTSPHEKGVFIIQEPVELIFQEVPNVSGVENIIEIKKDALIDRVFATFDSNSSPIALVSNYMLPLNLTKNNGIYVFNDFNQLMQTLDILELKDKEFIRSFYQENSGLSEEELEEQIVELEWNENYILDFMDEGNQFSSLRANIEAKITNWENINSDFSIEDPDKHAITDRYLRSLLTEEGEVIVGNSIFLFREDGLFLEIQNLDFDVLEKIKLGSIVKENAPDHVLDNTNRVGEEGIMWKSSTVGTNCKKNRTSNWEYVTDPTNSNRRIKGRVSINNIWISGGSIRNIKGETKSERRRPNGTWRGINSSVTAAVYTLKNLRDVHCLSLNYTSYSDNDSSNGGNVTAKAPINYNFSAASGDVGSTHYGYGVQLFIVVTW